MKSKILLLLFITISLGFSVGAKEFIKLKDGTTINCSFNQVCKSGIIYIPAGGGEKQFIAWDVILFARYKDGGKVYCKPQPPPKPKKVKKPRAVADSSDATKRKPTSAKIKNAKSLLKKGAGYVSSKMGNNRPDLTKDDSAATPVAIANEQPVAAIGKKDSLSTIPLPLPLVAVTDSGHHRILAGIDCKDVDFEKGFHDAEVFYKGRGARNAVMGTTFVFFPAGIAACQGMRFMKPKPEPGYVSDIALLNNPDYVLGYQLKARATRNAKMKRGFWWGLGVSFVTTTTLYFATGANHSDGSGGGGGGHHHH